ncbi:hypothetical protein A9975_09940 [Cupriavidus sp. UME77]|nr:hypothetical protein [Cupriavidus sp. UME77]
MFRAAFVSRSWTDPHEQHVHYLIPRPALPFGLLADMTPQHEHVWVENASLTSANTTHCLMALYLSCVRNAVHAASCTDFAILVFASAFAFTLPTKIPACLLTSADVSLWMTSLRWLAILAWIAFTRRFLFAR